MLHPTRGSTVYAPCMALLREGTNPVWGAFVLACVAGCLGLDFYWLFTESGPIAWLAAAEARVMFGHWAPKVTFLILLLAQVGAVIVLKLIIEKLTGKRLTTPVS